MLLGKESRYLLQVLLGEECIKKKKPTNPLFIDQKSKIKQTNEAKIDEEVSIEKAEVDAK